MQSPSLRQRYMTTTGRALDFREEGACFRPLHFVAVRPAPSCGGFGGRRGATWPAYCDPSLLRAGAVSRAICHGAPR